MDINQPIHNIEYLCRICLQEFPDIDNYFINFDSILEEPDDISYLQVFQMLTGFLVKDNEPQKICLQCKIKVESAYDLKKLAGITQKILEETLTKIEVTEVKVEVDLDVQSPEIQDFSDDDNKDDFFNSDSEYNPPIKVEKEAPKGKSYKCDYCDKDFQTYSGMFTHFKRIHPKLRNVRCEFCARRFYFEVQLKKHLSTCKKNKTYKPFDYKKYRAKYKQKIVCPVCGILADKSHMKIHEKRTEKDATINQEPCICDICGTTLQNRYGMIKHMKYQHLGHKVKCKDCENVFLSPSELQKHIRKMHKYVPREYHCRFCPFTTMKEHALRIHRKTHKEVRIFKCHVCGLEFNQNGKLTVHMASHSDARPHACETCGATFKTRKAIGAHKKTHRAYDYECPVCGKAYLTNQLMRNHAEKNHPEYQLPPPGTIFSKSWRLKLAEDQMKEMAAKQGIKPDEVSVKEVPPIEEFQLYQPYFKP